ncbi:PREDICTED: leukocyte receptor cluster member 1 [Rhagoletis zephyria]|uniref:leukocyte receptor cluster member 1 n=1 Tax=Rhagoletis zephyria TaxID=28612 RepID=UPI0008116A7F|nr:PREDICTED: leukocyte receptor cluster member 1 [Rhagoletis zephyria]
MLFRNLYAVAISAKKMNILPKKRWHVRTKDNIARVRRDEAAAKEEEQKRKDKLQLAESEARINFLRKKSGLPERRNSNIQESLGLSTKDDISADPQHVNLFADYRSHIKTTNKALEEEKKEEREKYEKQIGYLTYLGQDTNESLKLRSWYEVAPQREKVGEVNTLEKDLKNKESQDPLTLINALLPSDQLKTERPTISKFSLEKNEPSTYPLLSGKKIKKNYQKEEKRKFRKEKKHKKRKHRHKKDEAKKDKRYLSTESESDSEERQRLKREKIEKLRKERLQREATERARQEALLTPKNSTQELNTKEAPATRIVQKYNSQFNPEIAKQNII